MLNLYTASLVALSTLVGMIVIRIGLSLMMDLIGDEDDRSKKAKEFFSLMFQALSLSVGSYVLRSTEVNADNIIVGQLSGVVVYMVVRYFYYRTRIS